MKIYLYSSSFSFHNFIYIKSKTVHLQSTYIQVCIHHINQLLLNSIAPLLVVCTAHIATSHGVWEILHFLISFNQESGRFCNPTRVSISLCVYVIVDNITKGLQENSETKYANTRIFVIKFITNKIMICSKMKLINFLIYLFVLSALKMVSSTWERDWKHGSSNNNTNNNNNATRKKPWTKNKLDDSDESCMRLLLTLK